MKPPVLLLASFLLPLLLPLTGCSQEAAPAPTAEYKQLRDQGDAKADAGDRAAENGPSGVATITS